MGGLFSIAYEFKEGSPPFGGMVDIGAVVSVLKTSALYELSSKKTMPTVGAYGIPSEESLTISPRSDVGRGKMEP